MKKYRNAISWSKKKPLPQMWVIGKLTVMGLSRDLHYWYMASMRAGQERRWMNQDEQVIVCAMVNEAGRFKERIKEQPVSARLK